MSEFKKILEGGDLRSIGNVDKVVLMVTSPEKFEGLFQELYSHERLVVMRAADAIEKITIDKPEYLSPYKNQILQLCKAAVDKELKWHLAQLIPRLKLVKEELNSAWQILSKWSTEISESRIVRVNSIQALADILKYDPTFMDDFLLIINKVEKEQIPSINARIRNFRKFKL